MTPDNQTQTQTLPLPAGHLYFDGDTLTVGGQQLEPGRYTIPGTDAVLEVAPDTAEDASASPE